MDPFNFKVGTGGVSVSPTGRLGQPAPPPEPRETGKLAGDRLAVKRGGAPRVDPLANYPLERDHAPDFSPLEQADHKAAAIASQAQQQLAAIKAADAHAHSGNAVARGFNGFLNQFKHGDDALGVAKARAVNALSHDLNQALAQYHVEVARHDPAAEAHLKAALDQAQQAGQAFDAALSKYNSGNKFWSGIAADVVAGVAVVGGVALTATGIGAPIGVPLLAAGAFAVGGATAVGAHAVIDSQFDIKHEALTTFAVGGVSGVAAALTGGASETLTAGLTGTAARVVGQEAIQTAGARFAIATAANSAVGAGFGGATSGVQAIAAGEDAASVAKAMALGAAGGAVGGVAAHGLGAAIGHGAHVAQRALATEEGTLARTVNAVVNASESRVGAAAGVVAKGATTGAGAGGAGALLNQLASGQPLDYARLRDQILAGALQGGALSGAGLAGKALPGRSPVKAPPTPVETQKLLLALTPRGNAALAADHTRLVEAYQGRQRAAIASMESLRQAERAIAQQTDPAKRALAVQDSVAAFDKSLQEVDAARGQLVDFARRSLPPDAAKRVVAAVGEPNRQVDYNRDLSSASGNKHNEAVLAFLAKFPDLGLERGTTAPGVSGLSPRAMQSVSEALNTAASSSDAKGAANVEHLASVLKGVLETAAAEKGAPLTQAEVDQRAAVTVLTDAWMKGGTPTSIGSVPTAATNAGSTAGAIWERQVARSLGLKGAHEIPDQVRPILAGWVEGFKNFQSAPEAAAALEAAGVPRQQAAEWGAKFVNHPAPWPQSFMLGTWTHGIPAFGAIEGVVKSLGGDHAMAQSYYEEVLAHHASGFVMSGFSKADLTVDFHGMAREGALSPEAAQRLTNLYSSATSLAGKWRPVIDQISTGKPLSLPQYEAFRQQVGFKPLTAAERTQYEQLNNGQGRPVNTQELLAFRRAYSAEASDYREAIAKLPANSRSQLLNDDRMQFTTVGMPKWLNMMQMLLSSAAPKAPLAPSIDNRALLGAVYNGAVQPYAEENYARGAAAGQAFDQTTAPIAARLGMAFDPATRTYHQAAPHEPAFGELARRITADAGLATRLAEAKVNPGNPEAVVDWFRSQPSDPTTLARLVSVE